MPLDTEIIILGAGCAGLSLAVQFQQQLDPPPTLTIIDPKTSFPRDRTWCFWDVHPNPFRHSVRHTWDRWSIHQSGEVVVQKDPQMRYQYLPSDAFYEDARAILDHPNVTFLMGETATDVKETETYAEVHTDKQTLRCKWVFDSRPPDLPATPNNPKDIRILQHFKGIHIKTQQEVFDPTCVRLMDFDVDQSHGIHFLYVLPFSKTEALLEATFFTPQLLEKDAYDVILKQYAEKEFGLTQWELIHEEFGIIPMFTEPFSREIGKRIVGIGTRGGAPKPSTGYAFLPIQQDAEQIAKIFKEGAQGKRDWPALRTKRNTFLDRVFLSYIARHPDKAPGIFFRLFKKTTPQTLLRFLSDTGTLADDLRIMTAMPKWPLILETLLSHQIWWRHS